MDSYFNINYEFDRETVLDRIAERLTQPNADYICVADGVILDTANREPEYLEVVNSGMFSICDSSYVPLYIRLIHGNRYEQYCGAEIFRDVVSSGKFRMIFMGAQQPVLDSLRKNLAEWNPAVCDMQFVELPFCDIEDFDYPGIAEMIVRDGAEIVWVALGAPKQEYFMYHLKPYLPKGVMIAVGAAFNFYSDVAEKRAPMWMVRRHMEFLYRIGQQPKKQLRRCGRIIRNLPRLLREEWQRKNAVRR